MSIQRMSLPPLPPPPPTPAPPLTMPPLTKVKENSILVPHLGDIDFSSTNREFSLEETETDKIIKKYLKPIHATDPNILRFIDNYLHCRDAKQAARLSGLHGRDGRNLMMRKDICTTLQKITATAVRKFGYDAEEIVERVKEVAFIDPIGIQNDDGSFKNKFADMEPEVRRAIKKLKVKNLYATDKNDMPIVIGEIIEIEFWDKMKAVEMLGTEKNTFKKTTITEHDVSKNMRDVLLASGRRAEQKMIEMREVGGGDE